MSMLSTLARLTMAPFTLAQAQGHLSSGPIGGRIAFHRADPVTFLKDQADKTWDVAVLAHCIWYFNLPRPWPRSWPLSRGA